MLCEVHNLLRLYLTITITSTTAERSFSPLWNVLTYLWSSMTQQRLNNCMLLHIHTQLTDSLDLIQIAKDVIAINAERKLYLVHSQTCNFHNLKKYFFLELIYNYSYIFVTSNHLYSLHCQPPNVTGTHTPMIYIYIFIYIHTHTHTHTHTYNSWSLSVWSK